MQYLFLIISLAFFGVNGETFYRCYWITSATVDCSRFADDVTCGTNLVTYKNKCEFSKAHCNDNHIDLLHYGACMPSDGTTPAPSNVAGSDVVFDFMCTSLSHMDCPTGGEKVCASDGQTYDNYCEYEKQKCTHRNLHVVECTA